VAKSSHNRRAGELLAQGVPAEDIGRSIVQAADAVDSVELLANVARDAHVATPALDGLAALVQGRIDPGQWTATVTEPARPRRSQSVRVA
jgi:glycerol-3-phosphate dehydrogenase